MQTQPDRPASRSRLVMAACAGLLVTFWVLSWIAFESESPTVDEPLHAGGAYFQTFEHDFRVNPEDPPLWKYWAMIPHHGRELQPDPDTSLWPNQIKDVMYQFPITTRLLFQTPGNDGAKFINRSRAMMLLLGVALGVALTAWAWRVSGAVAAVFACVLFTFDPNFLGHASLVKNDVSFTLALFGATWACWSVGKRATWWNLLLLAILGGVALVVKFSGVLVGPIVAAMLIARAMLPTPWQFLRWELTSRASRSVATLSTCAVAMVISVIVVWASYGFRYNPTPLPGVSLNTDLMIDRFKGNVFFLENHRFARPGEASNLPTPTVACAVLFAQDHQILPQAWLFGFLYTYQATLVRDGYLLGEHSDTGFWYYFPLAMLFKTPLATLAACAIAIFVRVRHDRWTLACLLIPIVIYGASALTTNLNLGIRHILPVYPFIYILIGAAVAKFKVQNPRTAMPLAVVLGLGLAIESFAAFPYYISFFNAPSRPYRLHLLSDSNLDWGQDLPYLAEWQRRRAPSTPLYLAYFGTVDPAIYGIEYLSLPGNFALSQSPRAMLDLTALLGTPIQYPPGIIAVSATVLQGSNQLPPVREYYKALLRREPKGIVGDSIYLYDWPLR